MYNFNHHSSPIHEAAKKGDASLVLSYLEQDISLLTQEIYDAKYSNLSNPSGGNYVVWANPLELAALYGHADLVKALIRKGGKIDKRILQAGQLTTDIVAALKDVKYKKVGEPPTNNKNIQSIVQNINLVRAWIKHDPCWVNAGSEYNNPLYNAIYYGTPETVQLLLEHGAILSEDILSLACSLPQEDEPRCLKIIEILIKFGAGNNPTKNANIIYEVMMRSISQSIQQKLKIIERLISLKIDWNCRFQINPLQHHSTLLHTAFSICLEALPILCKGAGEHINQVHHNGLTLMQRIAIGEIPLDMSLSTLEILFKHQADPTVRAPHSNMTAYQLAYTNKNYYLAARIEKYTDQIYSEQISPHNTIPEQVKQLRKPSNNYQTILERLNEIEKSKTQLEDEKEQLLALLQKKEGLNEQQLKAIELGFNRDKVLSLNEFQLATVLELKDKHITIEQVQSFKQFDSWHQRELRFFTQKLAPQAAIEEVKTLEDMLESSLLQIQ